MGALNKFLGKPQEIDLEGEKIQLHPLKVKDMSLFSKKDNLSQEESADMSKKILQLSNPDATTEEIENLPMDKFVVLMEEINKLNGFTDERLDKIKQRIK